MTAGAMRPLWSGSLSFGLVNIPVQLYSAVQAKERISFRLLHKEDLGPIRYARICENDGEPVDWADIVKGYEYAKGKFVILNDDDFKAATIESSSAIEIQDFVRADEIDPRYFESPYYIVPAKGGEKAYALLREAIRESATVGIGKVTLRTNAHHLAGVKTVGDAMVLEIMRFGDELVDAGEFSFPAASDLRPQELSMAEQLVQNLSESFDPSKYTDDYRKNLMKIIKAKMKGKTVTVEEPAARESTEVVDLMARLKESLEAGKRKQRTRKAHREGAAKTAKRRRSA
jgi:DNA end-binding protein Ku